VDEDYIELPSGAPYTTMLKELLETIVLYKDNFPDIGKDFKGLCTLFNNEIELQLGLQEDTIREFNRAHGGVASVKNNVKSLVPKDPTLL
jgi:hypothetical protein